MENMPNNEKKEQIDQFEKLRKEIIKLNADIKAIRESMEDTRKAEETILAQLKELSK